MDSVTQLAVGAIIGEKTLGHQIGNKAILWGALIGTFPDLDVFLEPFFDPVENLFVHRGFSHSLLFSLMASPLLGMLLRYIYPRQQPSFQQWSLYAFWILLGAVSIDYLTTYGASIFWPFSGWRIEVSSMAIVDVFFTLPVLAGVIIILFKSKQSVSRKRITHVVFYFALIYLLLSVVHKTYQQRCFINTLESKNRSFTEIRTQPLPLTNFLWMGLAKTEEGYWLGFHSLFSSQKPSFSYIPSNSELIEPYMSDKKVERLLGFTKNYYTVVPEDSSLVINDLRFGKLPTRDSSGYVFSFEVRAKEHSLKISQRDPEVSFEKGEFRKYLQMTFGNIP
jgi:inner membrane protein